MPHSSNRRPAAKVALALGLLASAAGAEPPLKPSFDADGVAHVPAFPLPPSDLSSPEARAFMKLRATRSLPAPPANVDIITIRKGMAAMLAPQVARLTQQFPVDIAERSVGGVPVRIVTPHGRPVDPKRVLINVHGGGFSMCWETCSLLESVPIAAQGDFRVISVNYRMGPEARHPAALEDMSAVYRELLKTYRPQQIGLFGCSAGGALTAQFAAWAPAHGLPQVGAAGIFGAGGVRFTTGDSAWIAAAVDGSFPAPGQATSDITQGYFKGVDMNDPVISPALHPEVAAKFPPSLIITGTRAMDMSPAIVTNSALLKAGVRSTLIVGEAMGHCYIYQSDLPEARDAQAQIVKFFKANLK